MRNRTAALLFCAGIAATAIQAEEEQTSAIPSNLTQLRPIQCIAYDPKPSDFGTRPGDANPYFDSDFFNSDFKGMWGKDGGDRNDLGTFRGARLNLLHLYNWNAQRTN